MERTEIGKSENTKEEAAVIEAEAVQGEPEPELALVEAVDEAEAETELEEALRERDEFLDLLQRKQAEFENYRKRVDREKTELRLAVKSNLMEQILDVVEACEKGLETLSQIEGENLSSFVEGYELLLKQLKAVLERHEVSEIQSVGSVFDPNLHEAVFRETTDEYGEGEILEEYRKGYMMADRLLRPSQVKVATPVEE